MIKLDNRLNKETIKTKVESEDPYIYSATLRNQIAYGETRAKAKTKLINDIKAYYITCNNCSSYIHLCNCGRVK